MSIEISEQLAEAIAREKREAQAEAVRAFKVLAQFKPESRPEFFEKHYGYSKGDEHAPFFSEAFLYTLLGKEDARTLLGRMRRLAKALAITDREF